MGEESLEQAKERAEKRWKDYHAAILDGKVVTRVDDPPIHAVSIFTAYPSKSQEEFDPDDALDEGAIPLLELDSRVYETNGEAVEVFHTEEGKKSGLSHASFASDGTVLAATVAPSATYLEENEGMQGIAVTGVADFSISFLCRSFDVLMKWGQDAPWFVGLALLGLPRCKLFLSSSEQDGKDHEFPGGDLVPELITIASSEEITEFDVLASHLQPLFDSIWKKFGAARCLDYSSEGRWIGSSRRRSSIRR